MKRRTRQGTVVYRRASTKLDTIPTTNKRITLRPSQPALLFENKIANARVSSPGLAREDRGPFSLRCVRLCVASTLCRMMTSNGIAYDARGCRWLGPCGSSTSFWILAFCRPSRLARPHDRHVAPSPRPIATTTYKDELPLISLGIYSWRVALGVMTEDCILLCKPLRLQRSTISRIQLQMVAALGMSPALKDPY